MSTSGGAAWSAVAGMQPLVEGSDAVDTSEQLFKTGVTDGLPCVAPTRARVWRMLRAAPRGELSNPAHVLGKCAPSYNEVTVQLCAVAAVMAGCEPRQFPVVLAATAGMISEKFNIHGVSATTMGATPCVIVNGPVRLSSGVSSGIGALGAGNRANATVGRAIKLVLQNVGEAKLGGTESTTIGSAQKFTLCLAEAEEYACGSAHIGNSPGTWEPLHTLRAGGFNRGDSAVTVLGVASGPTQLVDFNTTDAGRLVELLAGVMVPAWQSSMPLLNECLLVISPEHFDTLRRGRITSKKQLQRLLWRQCNIEMTKHVHGTLKYLLLPRVAKALKQKLGGAAATALFYVFVALKALALSKLLPVWWLCLPLALLPAPTVLAVIFRLLALLGLDAMGKIGLSKFSHAENLHIVVAGSASGKFSQFYAGFGAGKKGMPTAHLTSSVTVPVQPTDYNPEVDFVELPQGVPASEAAVVVDPRAKVATSSVQPASRSNAIQQSPDLVVGLLDISKGNGDVFLDRVEELLLQSWKDAAGKKKPLSVRRYVKPTFSRPAPLELRQKILKECTHVVTALGD